MNMVDSRTIKYHNDFVTSIDVSNLSPFCFASADADGKIAVWKLCSGNLDIPIFTWENQYSVSKLKWNNIG